MKRPRRVTYAPPALLTAYYRRQAEHWQAEAEAQAARAASLQASLARVLERIERLTCEQDAHLS